VEYGSDVDSLVGLRRYDTRFDRMDCEVRDRFDPDTTDAYDAPERKPWYVPSGFIPDEPCWKGLAMARPGSHSTVDGPTASLEK